MLFNSIKNKKERNYNNKKEDEILIKIGTSCQSIKKRFTNIISVFSEVGDFDSKQMQCMKITQEKILEKYQNKINTETIEDKLLEEIENDFKNELSLFIFIEYTRN